MSLAVTGCGARLPRSAGAAHLNIPPAAFQRFTFYSPVDLIPVEDVQDSQPGFIGAGWSGPEKSRTQRLGGHAAVDDNLRRGRLIIDLGILRRRDVFAHRPGFNLEPGAKIGRASCRERV